jgi:hypothetical protein
VIEMLFAGIHFPPCATKMQNRILWQQEKMKKKRIRYVQERITSDSLLAAQIEQFN